MQIHKTIKKRNYEFSTASLQINWNFNTHPNVPLRNSKTSIQTHQNFNANSPKLQYKFTKKTTLRYKLSKKTSMPSYIFPVELQTFNTNQLKRQYEFAKTQIPIHQNFNTNASNLQYKFTNTRQYKFEKKLQYELTQTSLHLRRNFNTILNIS